MSGYASQIAAILIVNIVAAYSAYMPLACGQLNLGIAGFMAIGAYTSAVLSNHGFALEVSILCGACASTIAGFAVSRLDDVPGMAVMRTVAMLANEAADTVNQGVCSSADADMAMQKGVNYPRGPLAWADAIGLETIATVLSHLAQAYGEDRYRVSPLIMRKRASGGRFHV